MKIAGVIKVPRLVLYKWIFIIPSRSLLVLGWHRKLLFHAILFYEWIFSSFAPPSLKRSEKFTFL